MYLKKKKKSFVATSQAPFRSTFDRSRLLGDIDNLVNLFCNRFDMAAAASNAQRTSGLLVSMLDVVDPPSSKGFDIWPSNFHSPLSGQIISLLLFSPFCLDEHLFSFDSSQLPQICCQLGALAITVTQITLSFSSISRLKYLGPIKMNVLFSRRYTVTNNLPKMDHCTQIGGISLITCFQSCTYEMLTCCGTVNTAE